MLLSYNKLLIAADVIVVVVKLISPAREIAKTYELRTFDVKKHAQTYAQNQRHACAYHRTHPL